LSHGEFSKILIPRILEVSKMKEPESWERLPARFGDRVRIRLHAETATAGIAGRLGLVSGITTVSVTGVEVVGSPTEDIALNVEIERTGECVWLAPALVEFIDHNPGATITLDGVPKRWTRDGSGHWIASSRSLPPKEWFKWLTGMFRK
jgi:hypothetical protein